MKKRIIRLRRWLDRLSVASENKHWDSAIAAADCLNAETREIRDELCGMFTEETKRFAFHKFITGLPMYIKTIGIALIIVMLSSMPISIEPEKKLNAVSKLTVESNKNVKNLNWLTKEEAELLSVFRSDFTESSQMSIASASSEKVANTKKIKRVTKKTTVTDAENIPQELKSNTVAKSIAQEDLLTLIQVGEKALRGDSFGIKVVK
ncbi:MAG: hypothetical protein GXZ18_05575 [Synergistaceae bacterium]|nr:hypothetical protein [Synergistaceae bacterium]